jgi:predicted lipid-binding transport protein (Tim44 family)
MDEVIPEIPMYNGTIPYYECTSWNSQHCSGDSQATSCHLACPTVAPPYSPWISSPTASTAPIADSSSRGLTGPQIGGLALGLLFFSMFVTVGLCVWRYRCRERKQAAVRDKESMSMEDLPPYEPGTYAQSCAEDSERQETVTPGEQCEPPAYIP